MLIKIYSFDFALNQFFTPAFFVSMAVVGLSFHKRKESGVRSQESEDRTLAFEFNQPNSKDSSTLSLLASDS
jgi:hypothetical protein